MAWESFIFCIPRTTNRAMFGYSLCGGVECRQRASASGVTRKQVSVGTSVSGFVYESWTIIRCWTNRLGAVAPPTWKDWQRFDLNSNLVSYYFFLEMRFTLPISIQFFAGVMYSCKCGCVQVSVLVCLLNLSLFWKQHFKWELISLKESEDILNKPHLSFFYSRRWAFNTGNIRCRFAVSVTQA